MDERNHEAFVAKLEKLYPDLDPALIRSVFSDYDVSKEEQVTELHDTLKALKELALTDDASTFDHSGTSGQHDGSNESSKPDGESSIDQQSVVTESTSPSSLGVNRNQDGRSIGLEDYESLSHGEKLARLCDLFCSEKESDLSYILKKANGSFSRALDESLNKVFIEEHNGPGSPNGFIPSKGVDGFAEEFVVGSKRRKNRRKGRPSGSSPSEASGVWDSQSPAEETAKPLSNIIPHYAPVQLDATDDGEAQTVVAGKALSSLSSAHRSPSSFAAQRNAAFAQASSYAKKGNSSNHLGAAAAYYASIGRENHLALQTATSAQADELVRRSATSTSIDLHGVNAKDAARIAQRYVARWWDDLGERTISSTYGGRGGVDVGGGFRIVVGKGTHSAAGKGVLGNVVVKTLMQERWKVRLDDAVVVVTGKYRR